MRLDHVSYAAEPDGLRATAARLGAALGVAPVDGGMHPRFGTRNVIFPIADGRYVEVVEVLDHPASDKAPFGQAVRARSADGGGWLCWVVEVSDLAPFEMRIGHQSDPGNRHRPDGVELRWRQIGVKGLLVDPQLPYMIHWDTPRDLHPSAGGSADVVLTGLEIAGDPQRVRTWLGLAADYTSEALDFTYVAPHGTPGLLTVTFMTPTGPVEI
ncbi:VOC family protein [Pengzhenrongella frigida]|uniref:VOC family protein n=1 Tax=Pengzhenrongella frigida TaxID=1259133 RepID=A0A4Q5N6P1_9MICO|nr:VOC family protein [Cellulomonas sp. HLT2-17]RYV51971.1 VOC family protein [Cellulomonas sp. HLT2-17]